MICNIFNLNFIESPTWKVVGKSRWFAGNCAVCMREYVRPCACVHVVCGCLRVRTQSEWDAWAIRRNSYFEGCGVLPLTF